MNSTMSIRKTRFSGTLAAVALVFAVVALASTGIVARAAGVVDLTYTVWFAPAMTGVVGGDFAGTFGGSVVSTPIPNSDIVRLDAVYVITANDPSNSFTARVQGTLDTAVRRAVLNGNVTSGSLAGERAHSEFRVISSCPGKPSGPCFEGTLRLMG